MKSLLILLIPLTIFADDVELGSWKDYLSYNSASYIAETKNVIYCVASGGIFYVQKSDNTLNRISKITGLSDLDIKQVAYSNDLDITIITYENCNIDLIKNNQVLNLSDIKRSEITGIKEINNITIRKEYAYISCSFGLVVINLEKEEIKDTYYIGNLNNRFEVNGCTFIGDSIIAITSEGVFFANENSQTLSDYNNWSEIPTFQNAEAYDNIMAINDTLVGDFKNDIISISFSNNILLETKFDRVFMYNKNGEVTEILNEKFKNIKYAYFDDENNIWVADSINGLLKFSDLEYVGNYTPDGPVRNNVYSLEYEGNKLYQCHGGHENFGLNSLINDGASVKNSFDGWVNYNSTELGNSRDILEVAVHNGYEYYASWYHGIAKMKNEELEVRYGYANTNGNLDTTYYSNNRIRISDIKFDTKGNMWALSSEVNNPIVVKTPNDEWYSYSMNQSPVNLFLDDLIIDQYDQKWGVLSRGKGLFVYNNNNTIDNFDDDEYKILNTNIGSGNLPSMQTYSIAEDLDGEIWVGTDKGVAVFYNPQSVFSGYNFDSQQILIIDGDYGQYLLSEEKIKCISVDGANRKWIGTEKSGVFLLSENGEEEIKHFTKDNSPLFSNNIIDIAINHENGEVFIGTDKGVISFRSDATKGEVTQGTTKVFPNPVSKEYNGPIAISGLVKDANIKITDISGQLVFQTIANGGQAIWDGKNKNGERVSTGVYLVFSTDELGQEKKVSKILFVH